jgi:hypothetical protein
LNRQFPCSSGRSPARFGHLVENSDVDLARTSWITLVVVCLIAAVLLAIDGYTGYAITVVAVGLAGAVNLT